MKPVLVDTSVFVDFFKNRSYSHLELRKLMEERRVLLSCYVKLELLLGVKKEERARLDDVLSPLLVLMPIPSSIETGFKLISLARQKGFNPSAIDFLIALQSLVSEAQLWTFDKQLKQIAKALAVEIWK